MAPTMVGEAIKGGMLIRTVLSEHQHHILSACIVQSAADHTPGSNLGASVRHVVSLPGTAAYMPSSNAMHAMMRAVDSNTCIAAVAEAPSQVLVTTTSHPDDMNGSHEGSVAVTSVAKVKVRTFMELHAVLTLSVSPL